MAGPPKWTIFYFIIYLFVQNNAVNCQYNSEGCDSSSSDVIRSLLKELGEKERNLLLNALLSIATNNGIIPDLTNLISSIPSTQNGAQTYSVPQYSNTVPLEAFETPYFYELPQNEIQSTYSQLYNYDLEIPTQPNINDIIFTLGPTYGIPEPSRIVNSSPSPSMTSLPSQSLSHSSSSSQSYSSYPLPSSQSTSASQSTSSSQAISPLESVSSSQSTASSQTTFSPQSIFSSYSPSPSQSSSSSHSTSSSQSSISQPSQLSSTSYSLSKTSASSQSTTASKQTSSTLPTSSQPSPIKPNLSSTPVTSSPTLHNSLLSPSETLGKSNPQQTTKCSSIDGKTTNSVPYNDDFPLNLEINLPAPNIPEPRITIVTTPAPIEKKTSPLKKMLPLILIAMLCNDRNNACTCGCNSPSIVPIPYPIPIPFPSCGNYNDDDDDDDDTPKKTNRRRREAFWKQALMKVRR